MPTDSLKDTLKKLHANLATTESVDGELKTLLQVLDDDIQALLKKESDQAESSELVVTAQALSAQLAVKHPHLEPILRELSTTLARMGI